MMPFVSVSEERARAARVAKWLVEKERPDEAVLVLAAWAATGPNDKAGQELLAKAFRIDPTSKAAHQAFEQMAGVAGDHSILEETQRRYDPAALLKLENEFKKPTFRRAQMGFNNNITSHGQRFHIQTEDSGLDAPHIITHLFADGGRVIKSHKRSYADAIEREGDAIGAFVRSLMKAQHMEMALALRDGRFDAVIAGREIGGMEELKEPPREDVVRRLSSGKRREAAAPIAKPVEPTPQTRPLYTLTVVQGPSKAPSVYELTTDVAVIGSRGAIPLSGEHFCHPEEAVLVFREGRLTLEDLEGGNGVFLRIREPVELAMGDEFVVGDQLLRLAVNPEPDDGPDPSPTYFYSSPKWTSQFRVLQVLEGGAIGQCVLAQGNTLQIGAAAERLPDSGEIPDDEPMPRNATGRMLFVDDPLIEIDHCVIEEQAGTVVLTDLSAQTGLFVRIAGEHELQDGDELLVGRTRLQVRLNPSDSGH